MTDQKPKVVVMCGSSRFVDIMAVCEWIIERDELAITMGLNLLPWWYDTIPDHLAEAEGCAAEMDDLHLCKIDMADEIFVVDHDVNGQPYIGSSTTNEIAYAESKGVHVRRFSQSPHIQKEVFSRMLAATEARKNPEGPSLIIDRDEIEAGRMAMGGAFVDCGETLETVYVNTRDPLFDGSTPVATFSRAAIAQRFIELWNAALPVSGHIMVCSTCHNEINHPTDHDGHFQCRAVAEREALLISDAQARQRGENLDGTPRRETHPAVPETKHCPRCDVDRAWGCVDPECPDTRPIPEDLATCADKAKAHANV